MANAEAEWVREVVSIKNNVIKKVSTEFDRLLSELIDKLIRDKFDSIDEEKLTELITEEFHRQLEALQSEGKVVRNEDFNGSLLHSLPDRQNFTRSTGLTTPKAAALEGQDKLVGIFSKGVNANLALGPMTMSSRTISFSCTLCKGAPTFASYSAAIGHLISEEHQKVAAMLYSSKLETSMALTDSMYILRGLPNDITKPRRLRLAERLAGYGILTEFALLEKRGIVLATLQAIGPKIRSDNDSLSRRHKILSGISIGSYQVSVTKQRYFKERLFQPVKTSTSKCFQRRDGVPELEKPSTSKCVQRKDGVQQPETPSTSKCFQRKHQELEKSVQPEKSAATLQDQNLATDTEGSKEGDTEKQSGPTNETFGNDDGTTDDIKESHDECIPSTEACTDAKFANAVASKDEANFNEPALTWGDIDIEPETAKAQEKALLPYTECNLLHDLLKHGKIFSRRE